MTRRLSGERWREIEALFDAVVNLDPAAREDRLQATADSRLRREVASLVRADGRAAASAFIEHAIATARTAWRDTPPGPRSARV